MNKDEFSLMYIEPVAEHKLLHAFYKSILSHADSDEVSATSINEKISYYNKLVSAYRYLFIEFNTNFSFSENETYAKIDEFSGYSQQIDFAVYDFATVHRKLESIKTSFDQDYLDVIYYDNIEKKLANCCRLLSGCAVDFKVIFNDKVATVLNHSVNSLLDLQMLLARFKLYNEILQPYFQPPITAEFLSKSNLWSLFASFLTSIEYSLNGYLKQDEHLRLQFYAAVDEVLAGYKSKLIADNTATCCGLFSSNAEAMRMVIACEQLTQLKTDKASLTTDEIALSTH